MEEWNKENEMNTAVCIGINNFKYFPESTLNGCVNDSETMKNLFSSFGVTDIKLLQNSKATKTGIITAVKEQLDKKPDKFFLSISSHGSYVEDTSGDEELDECVICYDTTSSFKNVITDDEWFTLLSKYPDTKIEVWMDTCHSGTGLKVIDLKKMAIGSIPYKVPRFLQNKNLKNKAYVRPKTKSLWTKEYKNVVLWAACKDTETACDACIDGAYCGAFSYYFANKFTNISRVCLYRKQFRGITKKYDQSPQLECSSKNKLKKIF